MARRRKQTKLSLGGAILVIVAGIIFKMIDEQTNLSGTQGSNTNYASVSVATKSGVDYGSTSDDHPTEALASTVLSDKVKQTLKAKSIRFNGTGAFLLNNNQTTLNTKVSSAPYVQLSKIDSLGRAGMVNAWLTKAGRQYQNRTKTGNNRTIEPVGWHQLQLSGRYSTLYNRGHSVGYALAGNIKGFDASEANAQNITAQTAWANQSSNGDAANTGQNYYETLIRRALDANKKVRYRVTPTYDGNNLVPAGNHLEAKSSDGSLEFNVFIPNVQPGVVIDYATGHAKLVN